MKVQFDTLLKDLDGKPLNEGDAPITLKVIAVRAVTTPLDEDRTLTGEAAFKRLELARKINAGGEIDIDPADAVLVRDRAAKLFGILVSGQVYELLK